MESDFFWLFAGLSFDLEVGKPPTLASSSVVQAWIVTNAYWALWLPPPLAAPTVYYSTSVLAAKDYLSLSGLECSFFYCFSEQVWTCSFTWSTAVLDFALHLSSPPPALAIADCAQKMTLLPGSSEQSFVSEWLNLAWKYTTPFLWIDGAQSLLCGASLEPCVSPQSHHTGGWRLLELVFCCPHGASFSLGVSFTIFAVPKQPLS